MTLGRMPQSEVFDPPGSVTVLQDVDEMLRDERRTLIRKKV